MSDTLSLLLFAAAGIGMLLVVVQLAALVRHTQTPATLLPSGPGRTGVSVLKPLCGHDDGLLDNIASFVSQGYAPFELLLGVRDCDDGAFPIACEAARRWPDAVRVILQEGEPGLNPKVNQLITLARAARYDVIVVCNSNVRVAPGYLAEIASHLDDPRIGLVTHPITGAGEERLGSLLDNLHLGSYVGPGVIAAKRVAGKDIVIGKSMALRRIDLMTLGGFAAVKDVLAEDYVMGQMISARLGKRVPGAVARTPVTNHSRGRSVADFVRRYQRWSVMHRQAVTPMTYVGQAPPIRCRLRWPAWRRHRRAERRRCSAASWR